MLLVLWLLILVLLWGWTKAWKNGIITSVQIGTPLVKGRLNLAAKRNHTIWLKIVSERSLLIQTPWGLIPKCLMNLCLGAGLAAWLPTQQCLHLIVWPQHHHNENIKEGAFSRNVMPFSQFSFALRSKRPQDLTRLWQHDLCQSGGHDQPV